MLSTISNETFDEEVIELDNNKITIKAHNPHGLYRVHIEKGRLPEHLMGSYTSKALAVAEAKAYLSDKKKI